MDSLVADPHDAFWAGIRVARRRLAADPGLWQHKLLRADELADHASRLGIDLSPRDSVINLWRLGLLRADTITLTEPSTSTTWPSADPANDLDSRRWDPRPVPAFPDGLGGRLSGVAELDREAEPRFHPFRIYFLYQLHRVFRFAMSRTQYLRHPPGIASISDVLRTGWDQTTAAPEFRDRLEHWQRLAELAIAFEPLAHEQVYNRLRWAPPRTEAEQVAAIGEHRQALDPIVRLIDPELFGDFCRELVRNAEILDRNRNLHTLIRLLATHERDNIRDRLGAAVLLKTMAETIRRVAEAAHHTQLPEEDEIGFGQWFPDARRALYGTERLLDAPAHKRRDFLTSLGLDVAVKVRCYVEGATEYGALMEIAEGVGCIEVIDVRGHALAAGFDTLSFRDLLRIDRTSQVFSLILIDGDRADAVRAVRKAAADQDFFGRFWIHEPDFEFDNFDVEELITVACTLISEESGQELNRDDVAHAVQGSTNASEFFKGLRTIAPRASKGEAWGRLLARAAFARNAGRPADEGTAPQGKLLDVVQMLRSALRAGYQRSIARCHLDPASGQLVPRVPP